MIRKASNKANADQLRSKLGLAEGELKLTAAVYTRMGAAKHLKETGMLPDSIGGPWNVIPMRLIIEERGVDPTLTPDELLVYDAIVRERRLPGGSVFLLDPLKHHSLNRTLAKGDGLHATRRQTNMTTLSAIPIKTPYIDRILDGRKTWEIRTKNTKKIGPVALIRSGSGTVVATATISNVIELTASLAHANARKMGMSKADAVSCAGCYAWVLDNVVALKSPVPYKHPYGAVTWVTLDEPTTKKVIAEAKRSLQ
jgi:hypothetical protein